jgi:uncharacterized protein YicC (UPF0701 family)
MRRGYINVTLQTSKEIDPQLITSIFWHLVQRMSHTFEEVMAEFGIKEDVIPHAMTTHSDIIEAERKKEEEKQKKRA